MEETFIGIRGVNKETFRKFRAVNIEEKLKLGEAMTIAMENYLEKRKLKKSNKQNIKELLKIKPFDWGKGTEKTSKEIDEILYGFKK